MAHVLAFAVRDPSFTMNPDYPNELGFVIKVNKDDFNFEALKNELFKACHDHAFQNKFYLIDPVEVTGGMDRSNKAVLFYCFDLKETKRYDYVSKLKDVLMQRNSDWEVHTMTIPALELYISDRFRVGGIDLFNGWEGILHEEV